MIGKREKMKPIFRIINVVVPLVFLAGCGAGFPTIRSVRISPFDPDIQTWGSVILALSPDGQYIIMPDLRRIDLSTGDELSLYDEYPDLLAERPLLITAGGNIDWSPDEQFIAVTGWTDQRIPGTNHYPIYILNTQTHLAEKLEDDISVFSCWSPFNTDRFIASNTAGWAIYNLGSLQPVSLGEEHDFQREEDVGGRGRYLWSRRLDIPVAFLSSFSTEGQMSLGWPNVVIKSFAEPMDYDNPAYSAVVSDEPAVGAIFDPTGEYVLIMNWECGNGETTQCTDIVPPYTENVTDSILTLVRWRTGDKYELFRLSQMDSQNLTASGDLFWSADGSTILVGMYQAPFIILDVQYP
jgi:hypothetical protein